MVALRWLDVRAIGVAFRWLGGRVLVIFFSFLLRDGTEVHSFFASRLLDGGAIQVFLSCDEEAIEVFRSRDEEEENTFAWEDEAILSRLSANDDIDRLEALEGLRLLEEEEG